MPKTSSKTVRLHADTPRPRSAKRSRRHDEIARELVARIDLVPDYTTIGNLETERALVAAFIDHQVVEDAKAEMRSFEADQARDEQVLEAALPDALRAVFATLLTRRGTMAWIREEVTYALGVEVGRRLGGAR